MQVRQRFHQIFFEVATISRLVCISLLIIHNDWKMGSNNYAVIGFIFTAISSLMLVLLFLFYSIRKFRNNIAPLIFIILIVMTVVFGLIETILYGLSAFKDVNTDCEKYKDSNKKPIDEIMAASMAYSLTSMVFGIALIVMLAVWPPLYQESAADEAPQIDDGEQRHSPSQKGPRMKSSRSVKSEKKPLSRSAKSRSKERSKKSEHSRRN